MRALVVLSAIGAALAAAAAPAFAQYKIVGPDGRVTYTDRPPQAGQGRSVPLGRAGSEPSVTLPLAVREPMQRFPVVLYTIANCQPCDAGRELLRQRGVPFQERTSANSAADQDSWLKLVGSNDAPGLTVGSQVLRGFSPATWNGTLDLAGYPRESRLPPNYVSPAPQPLVAVQAPRPAAPVTPPPPPPLPDAPPPPPGGIRF